MLTNLIQFAHEKNASDLHLCANRKAYARIRGQLIPLTKTVLSAESLNTLLLPLLDNPNKEIFNQYHAIDFAYTLNFAKDSLRIRAHYFQSLQGLTAVFRIIPTEIMSLKDLYAPEMISKVLRQKNGLILVTGATGSGKSTTLSAMIHEINQQEEKHIITIEDPIERVFQSHKSLIEQRELHKHTNAFHHALKDALRADPDIILIGELRDQDSVKLALQAAETGHLVLSTLHTNSAPKTIDRLLSYFPSDQSSEIRTQLAESLKAVIAQQLINTDKKRIALFEIMTVNSAISNLIRENQIAQIPSNIQTGKQFGMQSFEQHIEFLQKSGILSDLLAKKAQNLLNPEIYS